MILHETFSGPENLGFLTRCLVSCGLGCLKVKGSKVPTCSKRSDIARDRGLLALALYRSAEASQAGSVSQGSVSLGLFRLRCTQTHFGMVNQSRSEKAEARSLNASHIGLEKRKHVLPCIILVSWASFLQIGVQKQLSLIAHICSLHTFVPVCPHRRLSRPSHANPRLCSCLRVPLRFRLLCMTTGL